MLACSYLLLGVRQELGSAAHVNATCAGHLYGACGKGEGMTARGSLALQENTVLPVTLLQSFGGARLATSELIHSVAAVL